MSSRVEVREDAARRDRPRDSCADLLKEELSEKRIDNILAVLSKALKYAANCKLIAQSPQIGMFKVERPEIVAWDFAQYARLLVAAEDGG